MEKRIYLTATLLSEFSDEGDVREINGRFYRFDAQRDPNVPTVKRMALDQMLIDCISFAASKDTFLKTISLEVSLSELPDYLEPDLPEVYCVNGDEDRVLEENSYVVRLRGEEYG